MKRNRTPYLKSRREFLKFGAKGAGLIALGQYAPGFAVDAIRAAGISADKDGTIFVLLKLGGGNDGLNTLVPCSDDTYYEYRPNLALKRNETIMEAPRAIRLERIQMNLAVWYGNKASSCNGRAARGG